eukprot:3849148-Rhodomonas_salina.3
MLPRTSIKYRAAGCLVLTGGMMLPRKTQLRVLDLTHTPLQDEGAGQLAASLSKVAHRTARVNDDI